VAIKLLVVHAYLLKLTMLLGWQHSVMIVDHSDLRSDNCKLVQFPIKLFPALARPQVMAGASAMEDPRQYPAHAALTEAIARQILFVWKIIQDV
jgi:hypothetical protein